MYISIKEEFEWVIIIRKSTKNRKHIGQKKKDKRTNNDLQNIHIKDMHAKMILITNIHKRKNTNVAYSKKDRQNNDRKKKDKRTNIGIALYTLS